MPKFYTYEEFLKENNIPDDERFEECEECDGEGEHECSCGHRHDCENCMGEGRIDIYRNIYNQLKLEQEKKYKEWQEICGVTIHT